MNNTYAVTQQDRFSEATFDNTASGPWSVKSVPEAKTARKPLDGCLRPLGFGLVLALSTMTSVVDPWVAYRKQYSEPTSYILIGSVGHGRISLREARQLAFWVMAETEAARLRAAEREARRAFDIEDIV